MGREAYRTGRIRQNMQDGNREFISLLAFVNALGQRFDPTLLYQGKCRDLQDSWVEDLEDSYPAFFGATEKGWTNDAMGLTWIRKVFNPLTEDIARGRWRLLIVDGHSSHVNLTFLELCEGLKIAVLILPPHATHKLQPLDVTCFGSLANWYTAGLNKQINEGLGMSAITKRSFWSVFRVAWEKSFTKANITSGFKKCGIYPFNPEAVLGPMKARIIVEVVNIAPKTPLKSKDLRHFQKQFHREPSQANITTLFKVCFKLSAQHEIDEHVKQGLVNALKNESKRQRRGKKLNLLGERSGTAILFSTEEIVAAKQRIKAKEGADTAEKLAKEQEKLRRAEQKATETLHRALRVQEKKLASVAREAQKQAEIAARKAARSEAAEVKRQLNGELKSANKKASKRLVVPKPIAPVIIDLSVEGSKDANIEPVKLTSRGRVVKMPVRLRNHRL